MPHTKSVISVRPEESYSFTDFLLSAYQNTPKQWYRLVNNHELMISEPYIQL